MKLRGCVVTVLAGIALSLLLLGLATGQQIHRDSFEGRDPLWIKGTADAPFREIAHKITDETAHDALHSELIQFTAETGSFIYYTYQTPKALLGEDLAIKIRLKSDRPGMQLFARLVLPHERNPNNLDEPVTTLLRGDVYELVGHWQRLEVRRPTKLATEQQQILQSQLKKSVDLKDAYIDRLVVNVYGGVGPTKVWIDDLEIGPVQESTPFLTTSRPGANVPSTGNLERPGAEVRWDRDQLVVGGKRTFFRAIRHTDTPLSVLHDAGFNAVWMDETATAAQIDEAARLNLRIVPVLSVFTSDSRLTSSETLRARVDQFRRGDDVLFWSLGAGGLSQDQHGAVAQAAQTVRALDSRPLATDVWDGFQAYSRSVDMLGVHRWPLLTSLELPQYREWLNQRRLLAQPGTFMWTWVQTHLPDWYLDLVYGRSDAQGFSEPIGPQPEQIRLVAFTALAAGCRGLGFWSDRFLADSHQGRDRLLALALLNQEIQLLEPLLVAASAPSWIPTSAPEVWAAVFRTDRGVLVLPMWVGPGSQYVPGQAAVPSLTILVPQVSMGTQAWEVSPAEVRGLQTRREVGGMRVTLPEFGLTSAIVFTGDNGPNGLVVHFQNQSRQMRALAAQWAKDLATEELAKVTRVQAELDKAGHPGQNGPMLLKKAQEYLDSSKEAFDNKDSKDYAKAYQEAQRAMRPLRILMRSEWEEATRNLKTPSASPYALSYYTLPRHWQMVEQFKSMQLGANVLPDGDFEVPPEQHQEAWTYQESPTLDEVSASARRVTSGPHAGKQCLRLKIEAKNKALPPAALERTFLAINSPDVQLPPGSWVQISGWLRVPATIGASVDGAMLYDSAGDAPLAVRVLTQVTWQKYTLYRKVPASGRIHVTLALTGLGEAYFDDVKIEPIVGRGAAQ